MLAVKIHKKTQMNLDAFVLFACFAGISLLLSEDGDEITRSDLVVAAICLICTGLPIFALSWVVRGFVSHA